MARFARFELVDGDTENVIDANLNLGDFYAANDLDAETVNAIGALVVGGDHYIGGGAAGFFIVRRAE